MQPTMKKALIALGIVAILAAAFFWGGNSPRPGGGSGGAATEVAELPRQTSGASEGGAASPPEQGGDASGMDGTGGEPSPEESSAGTPAASGGESGIETDDAEEGGETGSGTGGQAGSGDGEGGGGATLPSASPEPSKGTAGSAAPPASGKPAPPAKPSPAPTSKPGSGTATPKPGKDEYGTDPVPSGKPNPVEWQEAEIDKTKTHTATLSVSAATILNNLDWFDEDKMEVLPDDGVIYSARKVAFYEGESVFDVLLREMKANKIHMEFEMTPIYNSHYIEGINNIYEFDCGELSGWMYKVNGWFPNYGSSRYQLEDGDVIEWVYTCDLGRDVGDNSGAGRNAA